MKACALSKQPGFTLIELMIVVAVLVIIAAIAIPAYNGYITSSRIGAERGNAQSLRVFLENYYLDNGTYVPGGGAPTTYNQTGSTGPITSAYGWTPTGDQGRYSYAVTASTATWSVVVQQTASSTWVRCDNRMQKCCDSSDTGSATPLSACP